MTATLNRVIVLGNTTAEPEMREVTGGAKVAELTLALNDAYRDKKGELVETVSFIDVVLWNRLAEVADEYVSKGKLVLIEGRLQQDRWEDKEGRKRSKIRIRADRMQFLGGPQPEEGARGAARGRGGSGRRANGNARSGRSRSESHDEANF